MAFGVILVFLGAAAAPGAYPALKVNHAGTAPLHQKANVSATRALLTIAQNERNIKTLTIEHGGQKKKFEIMPNLKLFKNTQILLMQNLPSHGAEKVRTDRTQKEKS